MVMGWGWDSCPCACAHRGQTSTPPIFFHHPPISSETGSLTEPGTHFPSRLAGQQAPWILPYACPSRISHQSLCPTCSLMRVLGTKLSESTLLAGESAQPLTSLMDTV